MVDNASADGSAAAIAAKFPEMTLIAEAANHGFAAAHRIAVRRARGRWLLLLNPDTEVGPGAIDRLLAFAHATPEAGIWGGRTLFADGSLNPASCWGRMTLWSLACQAAGLTALFRGSPFFNPEGYGGWDRGSVREVDIVSGCFLLIRRALWDRLGGFDLGFEMYGEEADLCLRARALGVRPMVTPEATILHHGGASEPVRAGKLVRLMRAKTALVRRHFPPLSRAPALALLRLWPLSRRVVWAGIAPVTGRAHHRESAAVWAELWARRDVWWEGYDLQDDPLAPPHPIGN